jgi:DNA-binding response OmpR family regulator
MNAFSVKGRSTINANMKNIVIYSPDFSLCYSLLMYLQTQYKVVATTDMEVVSSLVCSGSADLVIMDTEPDVDLLSKCEQFKKCKSEVPLILTYVFNNRVKESEVKIKKFVNEIFYKPFDLNEISSKLPSLLTTA